MVTYTFYNFGKLSKLRNKIVEKAQKNKAVIGSLLKIYKRQFDKQITGIETQNVTRVTKESINKGEGRKQIFKYLCRSFNLYQYIFNPRSPWASLYRVGGREEDNLVVNDTSLTISEMRQRSHRALGNSLCCSANDRGDHLLK